MFTDFKIIPLSKKNLVEATELAHSCFPDDALIPDDSPGIAFKASLEPQKYKYLYDRDLTQTLRYFVLIDQSRNKVIGTTGLYSHSNEPAHIAWLGWYCLDPQYRGKGLGRYLLQWTVDKARAEGNTILRLYTSDDSYHDIAQIVYEKFGFVKTGEEKKDRSTTIYKEMKL